MRLNIEQITEEALTLPVEARILLADRLVESLELSEDQFIKQSWITEANRRREEIQAGRIKTIPGDEALAHIRQLFPQ
jgi:putative addiction module component (TIGR02574 family)